MDNLGAKEHFGLPSFWKYLRNAGIITCLQGSGCNIHTRKVNFLPCYGHTFRRGPDVNAGCVDGSFKGAPGTEFTSTSGSRALKVEPTLPVILGCYYQRVSPLALSMLLVAAVINKWGVDCMVQALTGCLPVLLHRSLLWNEGSQQRLSTPRSFPSLGMVQDQEPNMLMLHARILPHMVMGISCIFCCFQDSIVWATIYIFRVYWSYAMGGYFGRSEHPSTLLVRASKMDEWCKKDEAAVLHPTTCISMLSSSGIGNFQGFVDDDRAQAPQGEDKGKKQIQVVAEKGQGQNGRKRETRESSSHHLHIWTERERRKKMKNMFSILQSYLPNAPPKADKSAVIEEAVNYIKSLEDKLHRLEKQKLERIQRSKSLVSIASSSTQAMFSTREAFIADHVCASNQDNAALPTMDRTDRSSSSCLVPTTIQTWSSPNVVLNVCGDDAQFVIYAPKKPSRFANICSVLDKYRLEVFFVHISSDADCCIYMTQARVANRGVDELQEVFTVEERYKQAAREIIMWVSS